jgi:hypothetical protein
MVAATGMETTELAVAQTPMDNATNANMMAQNTMTSSAGNMTDANMTQLAICRGATTNVFEIR